MSGLLWPKMMTDAIAYAKRYHAYQIHTDYIHKASEYLYLTIASWPFEVWVINVVGPITPPSSKVIITS